MLDRQRCLALGVAAQAERADLEITDGQVVAGGAFDRTHHGVHRAVADGGFGRLPTVLVRQLHGRGCHATDMAGGV